MYTNIIDLFNEWFCCNNPINVVAIYLTKHSKGHLAHLNPYFPSAVKLNIKHPAQPTYPVEREPFLNVIAHKSTCNVSSHKWPVVHSNESFFCV